MEAQTDDLVKALGMTDADVQKHRYYQAIIEAVAQGWCWPDTEKIEMDVILAQGIVRSLLPVVDRIVQNIVDSGKR